MSALYFDSQNAAYVQALYEDFTRNPEAVPRPWREFFENEAHLLLDAGLIVVDGGRAARSRETGAPGGGEPVVPASPGPAPAATAPDSAPAAPGAIPAPARCLIHISAPTSRTPRWVGGVWL